MCYNIIIKDTRDITLAKEKEDCSVVKTIFKIIWNIIAILAVLLTLYFLFANDGSGIQLLKSLFSEGFFQGIKDFFVGIWDGFKSVVGL